MVFKVGRGTIPIYLGYIRGCAKPKYGTKNIAKRNVYNWKYTNRNSIINSQKKTKTVKIDYVQSFNKYIAKTYKNTTNLRFWSKEQVH